MNEAKNLEIEMAEIKTDIKYIKKSIDQNSIEHKDMITSLEEYKNKFDEALKLKADKTEVDDINNKIMYAMGTIIMLLLTIVGFMVKVIFF